MTLRVERVPPAVTVPLRHAVLRPHQEPDALHLPDDDAPDTAFFAAYDGDALLATGSVRREPPPGGADPAAWRVRGMATVEAARGTGVGRRVLDAVLAHVAAHGGGTVWCNARVPAVRFYERAGFAPVGDPWSDPDTGPHVQMSTEVRPS